MLFVWVCYCNSQATGGELRGIAMAEIDRGKVEAGASVYSKHNLSLYEWIFRFNCRYAWKCPVDNMLQMYNRHVTANHLDIGVGTGYFVDCCKFPSPNPRLVLMDLNPNCLETARNRLSRYNPEVYQRNVLEPFNLAIPPFDSVGLMNVLQCLPGDMVTKQIVFENVKAVLKPGGILFGSSIFYKGVDRNILATMLTKLFNLRKIFTNMEDDIEVFKQNLNHHFSESHVQIAGCEALFWAKK